MPRGASDWIGTRTRQTMVARRVILLIALHQQSIAQEHAAGPGECNGSKLSNLALVTQPSTLSRVALPGNESDVMVLKIWNTYPEPVDMVLISRNFVASNSTKTTGNEGSNSNKKKGKCRSQQKSVSGLQKGVVGNCVFPFTIKGVSYSHCADVRKYGGVGWCAFDSRYRNGRWGYCTSACPQQKRASFQPASDCICNNSLVNTSATPCYLSNAPWVQLGWCKELGFESRRTIKVRFKTPVILGTLKHR